MSLDSGNSLRIPNYLTAQTVMGLRRFMLLNNIRNGKSYNYFDFQFVNGKWFVWFYDTENIENLLSQSKQLSSAVNK